MTNLISNARRFLISAAAFGLASLSLAGAASASPTVTASAAFHVGAGVEVRDHRTPTRREPNRPTRYERRDTSQRPIILDPYHTAMNRYDLNRNRQLDASERKGFWTYMVSTGAYGQLSSDEAGRFVQLVRYFDLNADGRLIGGERVGMDKLIDSLRLFKQLDRNRDKVLTAYEVGFSIFSPRFYFMDLNRDRLLSQQEVRDEALRSYRDGECG
ncbi:MAG TPA: hypothetical protein VK698_21740 [Kofleriaceae bacterium]|nr:hypothetical protein [Kofleriaceae bacterium]